MAPTIKRKVSVSLLQCFAVSARSLYGIHYPVGTKLLTRLRVGLNHLRAHKISHNFQDTPHPYSICTCNQQETVEHFLLYCPYHTYSSAVVFETPRKHISLVTLLNPKYTCDLLLYGDSKYKCCRGVVKGVEHISTNLKVNRVARVRVPAGSIS